MLIQCVFHLYSPQSYHNTSWMLFIFVKCDINQQLEEEGKSLNVIKMHQGTERK